MNAQKYTQKTLEALTQAQNLAVEYGNPQLEQQHILWALCAQDGGVVPGILTSIGVDVKAFTYGILKTVEKLVDTLCCVVALGDGLLGLVSVGKSADAHAVLHADAGDGVQADERAGVLAVVIV